MTLSNKNDKNKLIVKIHKFCMYIQNYQLVFEASHRTLKSLEPKGKLATIIHYNKVHKRFEIKFNYPQ